MIAVIIPTYCRKDGKTPFYLKRCIDSVLAQTCQDFKLFVIGDKYENDSEIISLIPQNALYENLTYAYERDKYTGFRLWCCGGVNASNYGLKQALSMGINYIASLDHDDWWAEDHLQLFKDNTPFAWACTKSVHKNAEHLPNVQTEQKVIPFLPKPNGIVRSSVCWNYELLPFTIRNVYEETEKDYPGDADLWGRMSQYIQQHNLRSIFINRLTCFHEEEVF
ncbi:MAG: glycosyltransferase [Candidatus Omnitrophota bacterium]